jgi:hypothetical protein
MEKVIIIQSKQGSYFNPNGWSKGIHNAYQFKSLKDAREYIKSKSLDASAKSVPLEALITQAVVDYCEYEGGDRYGQLGCIDIWSLWGKSAERVKEWNETAKMFSINCYGGRFGSYYGIMGFSGILHQELKDECREAFANSERYKRAMTSW